MLLVLARALFVPPSETVEYPEFPIGGIESSVIMSNQRIYSTNVVHYIVYTL